MVPDLPWANISLILVQYESPLSSFIFYLELKASFLFIEKLKRSHSGGLLRCICNQLRSLAMIMLASFRSFHTVKTVLLGQQSVVYILVAVLSHKSVLDRQPLWFLKGLGGLISTIRSD